MRSAVILAVALAATAVAVTPASAEAVHPSSPASSTTAAGPAPDVPARPPTWLPLSPEPRVCTRLAPGPPTWWPQPPDPACANAPTASAGAEGAARIVLGVIAGVSLFGAVAVGVARRRVRVRTVTP